MVKSWANIILQFQSPQSILKYLERIVFEETRDVTLWISLKQKSISVNNALERITLTPKKWQLQYLNCTSHFVNWYDGFRLSEESSPPLPLEIGDLVRRCQTPEEAYSLYFKMRKDKSLRPLLVTQLFTRAEVTKNIELLKILQWKPTSSYEIMIALEFLIGMINTDRSEKILNSEKSKLFIPLDKKYYFDIHTAKGKKIIQDHFRQAFQNCNFQFGELDLRYSGSIFGCLWREYSFLNGQALANKGMDLSWSEAKIPRELYEKAFKLEKYYYPHLAKKLELLFR